MGIFTHHFFVLNIFVEPSAGSVSIASEYRKRTHYAHSTRNTDVDVWFSGRGCMSNLFDESWWKTATAADVRSELDANANLLADGNYNRSAGYPVYQGWTPLHWAAAHGTVATI